MTPQVAKLAELTEALITWRESDAGLSWEEFQVQQKHQHQQLREAIAAVRDSNASNAKAA